ncbi:hypothetical protein PGB90_003231 [Kerria lacca]
MQKFIWMCVFLQVAYSQIFEGDLSVSLQPPPPQPESKSDFDSVLLQNAPSLPVVPQVQPITSKQQLAHHAVLFTAEQEAKLPPNLLNPFYKNPRIAEQLAKQSWFSPGENVVGDRETEKISREKIYYALKSAGLIRRK